MLKLQKYEADTIVLTHIWAVMQQSDKQFESNSARKGFVNWLLDHRAAGQTVCKFVERL